MNKPPEFPLSTCAILSVAGIEMIFRRVSALFLLLRMNAYVVWHIDDRGVRGYGVA
ncbi:MAG: hypothetical protein PHP85_08805 [Gallionella sp.]|nr:hypothetical protein [Gallionella sp.]